MKLKQIVKITLVVIAQFYMVSTYAQTKKDIVQVQSHQVDSLVNLDFIILDVRTPNEIKKGKIADAYELDWFEPQFKKRLDSLNLDKSKPILVYCQGGVRSRKASQKLSKWGFSKVYNLETGYYNWRVYNDSKN